MSAQLNAYLTGHCTVEVLSKPFSLEEVASTGNRRGMSYLSLLLNKTKRQGTRGCVKVNGLSKVRFEWGGSLGIQLIRTKVWAQPLKRKKKEKKRLGYITVTAKIQKSSTRTLNSFSSILGVIVICYDLHRKCPPPPHTLSIASFPDGGIILWSCGTFREWSRTWMYVWHYKQAFWVVFIWFLCFWR